MSRVYLLVEGQTEEAFVQELLAPHFLPQGVFLIPIIVRTGQGFRGGKVTYAQLRRQLVGLCRQEPGVTVSTMFDLYALSDDFPGKQSAGYPVKGSGRQKAQYLEQQWAQDVGERNFVPNLLVHEFEALLFAGTERFADWTDGETVAALAEVARAHGSPEDINDHPQTAPSKRLLAAMPAYRKAFHGPLIACDIGLEGMRQACPHFHAWLCQLEALVSPSNLNP